MSDKTNDKINAELDDMIDDLLSKGRKAPSSKRRGHLSVVEDEPEYEPDPAEEEYDPAFAEDYPEDIPEDKAGKKARKKAEKAAKKKRKKSGGRDELSLADGYELGLPPVTRFFVRLFIFILLIGGLAAFAWYKCRITKFEVVGSTWYTDEEISDALRTEKYDDFSFGLKLHYTFSDTPEMPFINSFKIKMTSLDSVRVTVFEKKIVGCVKVQSDYMFFDKDGIVVASRSDNTNNIPVIAGLAYAQAVVGRKLEVENDRVFSKILTITQLIDKNKVPITTLDFDKDNNVTLVTGAGNRFYIGDNEKYDEIFSHLTGLIAELETGTDRYWVDYSGFSGEEDYFIGKKIDQN